MGEVELTAEGDAGVGFVWADVVVVTGFDAVGAGTGFEVVLAASVRATRE